MSDATYGIVGRGRDEASIADHVYHALHSALEKVHVALDPAARPALIRKRARECLLWEGHVKTTINHIQFLGAQHRPDFVVQVGGIRIAIELKRGESGAAVRDALGQCLVYASQFHFTCCVLVDTSRDKKLKSAFGRGQPERDILECLWDRFNVRLGVV